MNEKTAWYLGIREEKTARKDKRPIETREEIEARRAKKKARGQKRNDFRVERQRLKETGAPIGPGGVRSAPSGAGSLPDSVTGAATRATRNADEVGDVLQSAVRRGRMGLLAAGGLGALGLGGLGAYALSD